MVLIIEYCKKTYLTVFYPQYNSISGNKINGLSFKTAPFMGIYHDLIIITH